MTELVKHNTIAIHDVPNYERDGGNGARHYGKPPVFASRLRLPRGPRYLARHSPGFTANRTPLSHLLHAKTDYDEFLHDAVSKLSVPALYLCAAPILDIGGANADVGP
jgi:hypothetical protein